MFQGKLHTIANKYRLAEMGNWFQYGRRQWDKMPHIAEDDLEQYADDWWKWWCELQPPFRGKDPRTMSRVQNADAEWSQLLKGGPNGFFIILLAVGWWSLALNITGASSHDCHHALSDI